MMKSISTEDIFGVWLNAGRVLIVIFAALLAVMLINSISITQTSISDTDASTYIVVPMLMIPLFALFVIKENIVPRSDRRSLAFGIILFILFIVLGQYLRNYLSFLFFSYRIDMLIFPIAIISLAALLFGVANLKKFSFIAVYALFASPLLFLPIIGLNPGFATLNTLIVYHVSKLFFAGITYSQPITLLLNGVSVSIGESCVGIGALIGLVMFLIPLAYLYDGTAKNKALWVFSGFALMLVLNFLRMLGIALLWFGYGASESLLNLHAVLGQILFYGIIVVMIIVSGKYGMSYPYLEPSKRNAKQKYDILAIGTAVAIAILYFLMSLSFLSAQIVSPIMISSPSTPSFTPSSLVYTISSVANLQNYSSQSLISNDSSSAAIQVKGISTNSSEPLVILFGAPNLTLQNIFERSAKLYKTDALGYVGEIYELEYGSSYEFLYYRSIPYESGGSYSTIEMYVILPYYPYWENPSCGSAYQIASDEFNNALYLNFQNSTTTGQIDRAYCYISKVIK